ncbi:toll-like receptor 3 [Diadema antillarum]|uniref:toll-like receptor 3 n=1 Tax=Diadema antillarum TaxID=105358 RepID=UPI003A897DE5
MTGFFLQLFLLPVPSTSLTFDQDISSLPAPCQYLVKSSSVNCSRRGLTKIPTDIPLDTRRLSLSYNLLDQILNDSLGRLPELEFLSLRYNRVRLIDVGAFWDQAWRRYPVRLCPAPGIAALTVLDVSDSNINGLDPLRSTNLYKLDLTRTRIGIIPEQVISPIRESITSLDLSHNSLSCYCQNKWLRIWVHENYDKVFLSDTNCSDNSPAELVGHSFIDFQPILVCGPRVLLYACIAISGVAIVFTGIIIYYNRWWIKYKLFLLKLCIIGYREIIDDDEYHYDINIVFHDDDEEWVIDRMVPVVRENYPEAVLCVGDDDLRAGLLRLDAVADVIENSYKSVFVVSYAAIDSPWYMTKLRLALQHMNHSQRDAILLVFLENIADDRLPYIVRLLLGVNRPFLRWSSDIQQEEFFWDHFMKCVKKTVILNLTLPI